MGFKPRKRTYVVWLRNKTSRLDDEPIKVHARTEEEARDIARDQLGWRFLLGPAYTLPEFYRWHPGWKGLL